MIEFFDGEAIEISKYFLKFQRLQEEAPNAMVLKGDTILVERLPPVEMKTASGIIIADAKSHKMTSHDAATEFGIVLAVGPGQLFEDGKVQQCDSEPGDVILLPGNIQWYSQFGHIANYASYSIGRLRDSQVPIWFRDYRFAFEVLNG